jgi:hypothetical protein
MVTICLNMIVKNESKNILRLLNSVCGFIDYYVICDTGSTDDTPILIEQFFRERFIDGIIFYEEFVNFCHNRNVALQKCKDLTDYVLLLDADMVLEINDFDKSLLIHDNYKISQGSKYFYYDNIRIVKNDGKSRYIGVTHEYIFTHSNNTGKINTLFIRDYGDGGCKNNKFTRDRDLLVKGVEEEPTNERYHFYLANTYRDLGDHENAIQFYKKRICMGGWYEEKYVSCLQLYKLIKDESRFFYAVKSYTFNPKRVECILELIKYYACEKNYNLAYNYYTFIQNYYENEYYHSDGNISFNLFSNSMDYSFYLPYYMIIVCEHVKKLETGILMYKIIFKRKSYGNSWYTNNLIFNLQFYEKCIDSEFKTSCREYIQGLSLEERCNKSILLINLNN